MRIGLTLLVALAGASLALAQPSTLTRSRVPARTDLDRLNLKTSWIITLPVEGPRDGIATLQLIPVSDPTKQGAEMVLLVAQMRSGTISVHDAVSGRRLWSRRPAPSNPVHVPEVAYDPRGALVVVRDLNLYRFDVFASLSASTISDETAGKLITLPTVPSQPPTVIVADPTKREEGLIVLCFNGNKLETYGKNSPIYTLKRDTSALNWVVKRDDTTLSYFKPGDNKYPSLTGVDSVSGPDYGLNSRPITPSPRAPSLTLLGNLGIPTQFGTPMPATPSLSAVHRLTQLSDLNRIDAVEPAIESKTRRGDILDFRLAQPAALLWVTDPQRASGAQGGVVSKLVLVGTERDIQIDRATEKTGLFAERKIGRELLRSDISATAGFRGNMMVVPTEDGTVFCIDAEHGLVSWSVALQSAVSNRPAIVGPDVFVTNRLGRMYRLNVEDGGTPTAGGFADDGSFPNFRAKQFLAASDRYVYALDQRGNLTVLDRRRGTVQGQMEVRGFTLGYLNDVTDRIILASNDGTVVCLNDAGAATQKVYRSNLVPAGAAAPKAETPMGDAKPAVDKPGS